MKRFDTTHVLRINGDKQLALSYLSYGRKLLGYLAEQRALSGVLSCAITRKLPDGTIVRALFAMNTPILEITAGRAKKKLDLVNLEGFVVWPMGGEWALTRDFEELVLVPRKEGGYFVVSYDGAELPDDLTTTKVYQPAFPDVGLTRSGNVDWTNGGETLSVSWYGPRSRYFEPPGMAIRFTYGHTRLGKVFSHGQLLLDLWEEPYVTLLDGMDWGEVTGACLRPMPTGLVLIVALTYEDSGWHDKIIAVDVVGDAETPILTVDDDSARILAERDYEDDENDHYQHPVFFNPTATEGRCIRDDLPNDRRLELIVSVTEDIDGELIASFETQYHDYPVISTASSIDSTMTNVYTLRTKTLGVFERTEDTPFDTYAIVAPEDVDVAVYHEDADIPSNIYMSQYPTASSMTGGMSTEGWLVMGVDFRLNGEVTYLRVGAWEESSSGNASGSYTLSASDSLSIDSLAGDGSGGVDFDVSGSRDGAAAATSNWTNAQTSSWQMTYGQEAEYAITFNGSYNESQSSSVNCTVEATFSTSGNDPDGMGNEPTEDPNVHRGTLWYGQSNDFEATLDADSATNARSITYTAEASLTRVTEEMVFLFADLRRDLVVYIRKHDVQTATGEFTDNHTNDVSLSSIAHTFEPEADAARTRARTLVIERAGEVLYEKAYNDSTISETLTGEVEIKYDSKLSSGDHGLQTYRNRVDTINYDQPQPLPDDAFNTDGFSFADTALYYPFGESEFERTVIWPNFPLSEGGAPPDADAQNTTIDDSFPPDSAAIDTLWGQIGAFTLTSWPLSGSVEDNDSWQTYGAWAFYKDRHCFSTPAPEDNFDPGWHTMVSNAEADELLTPHDQLHPIWVLPKVRHQL